jgi:hypothetical protein
VRRHQAQLTYVTETDLNIIHSETFVLHLEMLSKSGDYLWRWNVRRENTFLFQVQLRILGRKLQAWRVWFSLLQHHTDLRETDISAEHICSNFRIKFKPNKKAVPWSRWCFARKSRIHFELHGATAEQTVILILTTTRSSIQNNYNTVSKSMDSSIYISTYRSLYKKLAPITVAAPSKAWTVFVRS